jgi:hypothetical protein
MSADPTSKEGSGGKQRNETYGRSGERGSDEVSDNEVKVTKCPPGRALGCDDLQRWASSRSAGRSGVRSSREDREKLKAWRPNLDAADRWLAKHGKETKR